MMLVVWLCLVYGVVALPQENPAQVAGQAHAESVGLEEEARAFLKELDEQGSKECTKVNFASWNYEAEITDKHKKEKAEAQLVYADWEKKSWNQVQKWKGKWESFSDPFLKRQFKFLSVLGTAALPKKDLEKLNHLVTEMQTTYSTAKICDYKNGKKCDLTLEPDLTRILGSSRNYFELQHVWTHWRLSSGRKMKHHYMNFVKLANEAAKLNGFDNMGDMWIYPYESDTFRQDVARLWDQLKPLYEQLHAYVRRKLREKYGDKHISNLLVPLVCTSVWLICPTAWSKSRPDDTLI
ncbi:angiotensin-converting enzyme-like [Macrobrachium rosenbergii]|uniref:angiotensin-converting enzyme-like n=1 Tax=Macrobrachium rosenbergii TaxID=79674 RepID=UPI0034D40FF5